MYQQIHPQVIKCLLQGIPETLLTETAEHGRRGRTKVTSQFTLKVPSGSNTASPGALVTERAAHAQRTHQFPLTARAAHARRGCARVTHQFPLKALSGSNTASLRPC